MDKRKELNKLVKDSIGESIFRLMKEKEFSLITVTEIINKAGVARASFYRNFTYKEDAIKYYLLEKMNEYKIALKKDNLSINNYDVIYDTMKFVMKYRDMLESLFKSNLSQVLLSAINTYLLEAYHVDINNVSEKYIFYSYGGSIFNIIYQWIESGAKESPEEIAEMICR